MPMWWSYAYSWQYMGIIPFKVNLNYQQASTKLFSLTEASVSTTEVLVLDGSTRDYKFAFLRTLGALLHVIMTQSLYTYFQAIMMYLMWRQLLRLCIVWRAAGWMTGNFGRLWGKWSKWPVKGSTNPKNLDLNKNLTMNLIKLETWAWNLKMKLETETWN